ncbi:chorismate-binding protein [Citricoccus sp. GCM10030269]|uniref:chorismate-binding protein n=1 Tax=Citricoccus sp. GCM10030269 TaxID=3273388 RepID=UPI003621256C
MKPADRTPLVLAIDGRSGAGKTSLALETAALLRPHLTVAVFHLDSIYPGWDGLTACFPAYHQDVVEPLSAGRTAHWRRWDWTTATPGELSHTDPADVVILEGVGAGNRQARPLVDAVAWVQMDDAERKRRALHRDGEVFAAHWDRWAAQEEAYLATDDVADAAWFLVDGPGSLPDAAVQLVEGLRALPGWEGALNLIPAPAPPRWKHLTVSGAMDPQSLFSAAGGPDSGTALLLESSDHDVTPAPERSRYSLIGLATGASAIATHTAGTTTVRSGHLTVRRKGGFFAWLASVWPGTGGHAESGGPFQPGWMGWIGYGLKREAGSPDGAATVDAATGPPEALLFRPGRGATVDHMAETTTLFWATDDPEGPTWAESLTSLPLCGQNEPVRSARKTPPVFRVRDSREEYLAKIRSAQHEIYEGRTYEVCLTTHLESTVASFDGWATYRELAAANRAPFNLYLRAESVEILSTSPERFLSMSVDGWMVTEPIKGTRPRGATPDEDRALAEDLAASDKDRAENIMITDLARNDLSRFARPGTLSAPRVCAVESYPTVHQMVSTVRAQLEDGVPRADALAAAFPPGSMTGAPKISTMHILEHLESGPRGVYSGVAGYLSDDGAADLNVLIRTLVAVPRQSGETGKTSETGETSETDLTLGVGGAITADSVPEEEWEEVRTKAHGVLRSLGSTFPL